MSGSSSGTGEGSGKAAAVAYSGMFETYSKRQLLC
jgi:hypothetical protein